MADIEKTEEDRRSGAEMRSNDCRGGPKEAWKYLEKRVGENERRTGAERRGSTESGTQRSDD